jgi:hypothetical protein
MPASSVAFRSPRCQLLATNTLILHHPLPILIVIHPNLPHELHHISLPQFQQQPAQRHLLPPVPHPHRRLNYLAALENSLSYAFCCNLVAALTATISVTFNSAPRCDPHDTKQKKAPDFSERPSVQYSSGLSRFCTPTLVSGRPELFPCC